MVNDNGGRVVKTPASGPFMVLLVLAVLQVRGNGTIPLHAIAYTERPRSSSFSQRKGLQRLYSWWAEWFRCVAVNFFGPVPNRQGHSDQEFP